MFIYIAIVKSWQNDIDPNGGGRVNLSYISVNIVLSPSFFVTKPPIPLLSNPTR